MPVVPAQTPSSRNLTHWWHGVPALPSERTSRSYFTLRRVWGDHTMAGNRGFYRTASEDHITVSLFHIWAMFPGTDWAGSMLRASGLPAGNISRVTWAYACEELLDARLQPFHKRNFVIPDIMLEYRDEAGSGLVAFEVKKPGGVLQPEDARKLETYCNLPSTRHIPRRNGCFLVDASTLDAAKALTRGWSGALTWQTMRELQIRSARSLPVDEPTRLRVAGWIARHYSRHGIGARTAAPAPMTGARYASPASLAEIRAAGLPAGVEGFLLGSECVEAAAAGEKPALPYDWLAAEPSAESVRLLKRQTTLERRINRWNADWSPSLEPQWA